MKMGWEDAAIWLLAWFSALAFCGARLAWMLFGVATDPPDDLAALKIWERKRRWLVISELAALPAFATLALVVGKLRQWPVEGIVLFSMLLGALGFAFFLDALQTIIRRRVGMNSGGVNG